MTLNPKRERLRWALYGFALRRRHQGVTLTEMVSFVEQWVRCNPKPDIFSPRQWAEIHLNELVMARMLLEVPLSDRGGEAVYLADPGRSGYRESDRAIARDVR